jgi:L-serine dehydratase
MDYLSVKDMFKIGIGPSSSHTLGPWRAAQDWVNGLDKDQSYLRIYIKLYGSLSLTGKGHATDKAILLGLSGKDPVTVTSSEMDEAIQFICTEKTLTLGNGGVVDFDPEVDIIYEQHFLDFHANAMSFHCIDGLGREASECYYSIGGGFITKENDGQLISSMPAIHPYPINRSIDLAGFCLHNNKSIAEIVRANELSYMSSQELDDYLLRIWDVMLDSMYRGCHTPGKLPGGLDVLRRAPGIYQKLYNKGDYSNRHEWLKKMQSCDFSISSIFKWISCFAMAVNEENAAMGRVVTAPTNGSAGVIPAVLMFYLTHYNREAEDSHIIEFLSVASEIGCIFKKGATISAAMGGCQAEIGVSSAMAAAALTHVLGGPYKQCIVAAEMAMEHHLGLTCDPIAGLVQVPCIERNSMGAIKAINAAELALDTDPDQVKIPLDKVVATMWATAQDMHRKYKETSEGGLAVDVGTIEC